jgi:hypothetical protein
MAWVSGLEIGLLDGLVDREIGLLVGRRKDGLSGNVHDSTGTEILKELVGKTGE